MTIAESGSIAAGQAASGITVGTFVRPRGFGGGDGMTCQWVRRLLDGGSLTVEQPAFCFIVS